MSDLLIVWLGGAAIIAVCALTGAGIVGVATLGMRGRSEARAILGCLAAIPLSILWPLVVLLGPPLAFRGLWREADVPTPMKVRAERRREAAIAADKRVREQAKRIAQLEREAGIR